MRSVLSSVRSLLASAIALGALAGCGSGSGTPALQAITAGQRTAQGATAAREAVTSGVKFLNAVTTGNSAQLFVSPAETLPAVKALIAGAQASIYIEVFNFGNDSYGQQLVPLLVEKARTGVEVKILMDEMGSSLLRGHRELLAALRAGGIVVQVYKTHVLANGDGSRNLNITHRKCFMADGDRALVGGVNLMAPFDTTTQDLLIRWRGPLVAQLYGEFQRDWQTQSLEPLGQTPVPVTAPLGTVDAQIAVTSPGEHRTEARDAISQAVDAAQHDLMIEQQYLWDDRLCTKLRAAAARGVNVRVLIPNGEQKAIQKICNGQDMARLVAAGGHVRYYRGITATAHLHTKYFSVDDKWAIAGSCNGDTRSLMDNQELDIATTNPDLIADMRQRLFETDWNQHAQPFTFQGKGFLARKIGSLLELYDYYL